MMIEVLIEEMYEALKAAGITEEQLEAVRAKQPAKMWDSLIKLRREEYAIFLEAWSLRTPEMWALYRAKEAFDFPEWRIMSRAARKLKSAWRKLAK